MKATELMINDWVMNGTNQRQVEMIGRNIIHFNRGGQDLTAALQYLTPITIDEDILAANGFDHFVDEEFPEVEAWRMDVDDIKIDIIPSFNRDRFTASIQRGPDKHVSVPVRYVHELQHALRLMGLDTMADNFKIK